MATSPKTLTLGSALRAARQNKDITLRDFAARLGLDIGMLSRWENGARTPKPEHVAQILATLGVVGEEYREIMTLVRDTTIDHWIATNPLEMRQHFAAYLKAEQNAALITSVSPLLIPGLLQTAETARAIMATETNIPVEEIEARVALRVSRRDVLLRPIPAQYTVLIGEGALRQRIGGPLVHLQQLRHLRSMSARPNVDLRVVPFDVSWHPGLEGAFHVFAGVTLMPSVHISSRKAPTWLHRSEDVNEFRRLAREVMAIALSAGDSSRFIAGLVHRMEQRIDHVAEVDP